MGAPPQVTASTLGYFWAVIMLCMLFLGVALITFWCIWGLLWCIKLTCRRVRRAYGYAQVVLPEDNPPPVLAVAQNPLVQWEWPSEVRRRVSWRQGHWRVTISLLQFWYDLIDQEPVDHFEVLYRFSNLIQCTYPIRYDLAGHIVDERIITHRMADLVCKHPGLYAMTVYDCRARRRYFWTFCRQLLDDLNVQYRYAQSLSEQQVRTYVVRAAGFYNIPTHMTSAVVDGTVNAWCALAQGAGWDFPTGLCQPE
jgi:hypothetical protein